MNVQVTAHIDGYPDEIKELYRKLRQLIFDSTLSEPEEKLWAKLPSYCLEEKFVRLIPFKDHINIEASALKKHADELIGYKITPKGMLQIYLRQDIPSDLLIQIFKETFE